MDFKENIRFILSGDGSHKGGRGGYWLLEFKLVYGPTKK